MSLLASTVAGTSAFFAIRKGLRDSERELEQRKDELEQRKVEFRDMQAISARDRILEILDNPKARNALRMLDFAERDYEDAEKVFHVTEQDVQYAMLTTQEGGRLIFTPKDSFIRSQFEALYDLLEPLEQWIQSELINFEDVFCCC